MSIMDIAVTPREAGPSESSGGAAHERYRTVELDLEGRYMRSCKLEYPARLKTVSVAQLAFTTPQQLASGERRLT